MEKAEAKKWRNLLDESKAKARPVSEGWRTPTEIAAEMGLSHSHVQIICRDQFRAGKLLRKKFRIQTGRGPYPVYHYKEK